MDSKRSRDEYDSIFFRTGTALTSGLVAGSVWGSVVAAWRDVPAIERNVALPALKKTLRIMGNYGLTYGAVAGVFAFTDASVEQLRGKKDLWNGVIGGLAAGTVLGIRSRSLRVGLAASGSLAAVSAIVDAGGHTTRTPIGREFLPYPTSSSTAD
ncbi:hypothetical protein KP509_24G074200 [Ceratopteris richardii]|uniref:Uncharacterized protein n=1 Tax=Ceratopteris richardii TaxID=49495 RepID=A0A8T2RYY5_CERRI|nr:hypothetical protein KP509_24G074200 [Ceratopteris richardii]KAH7300679.1 hypothetical protein KP509_24G074200 [Ceratopteris richardii]KAH7300680.1 hypothetical protein KP509_24G074200 [Ceratopteris richardii]